MSDAVVAVYAAIAFAVVLAFLLSLGVVRAAIAYAHRRGLLDQPGQRRSHKLPTPRGGGIGLVVATLPTLPLCLLYMRPSASLWLVGALCGATVLVAAVGWWDDHRSLPVLPRFGVQVLAATAFSIALLAGGLGWFWLPLLVLAGAWSINLHNFMDGIDGLLAQQGIFVAGGIAILAGEGAQPALAGAAACVAAACLGFWCYNRSPARIFMGDVGSGSIGLLLFALSAMLWQANPSLVWPALILSSAFVVDASLTLLTRMCRGRRWYTAHREHLYQWIVRKGHSHAKGAACYLGWNLLVAAPCAILTFERPGMGLAMCIAVYLIAAGAWFSLKRRFIRRDRYKVRHVHT